MKTLAAIDFSVRRVYVAAFAAIGYVLAHRSMISYDWTAVRTLGAVASDATILALLFFSFAAIDRWLQPESPAARGHKALHLGIALASIVLAIGAEALFLKTGEILDIGILTFFLENFRDLLGASQSAIDHDILFISVICLGFYAISVIQAHAKPLKILQYIVFLSPAFILISSLAKELSGDSPIHYLIPSKGYNRMLVELAAHQSAWISKERPAYWRQGILSGLPTSTTFGLSEYNFIQDESQAKIIYSPPIATSITKKNRPNILFVLLESTRADVIGAYTKDDGHISHTPFLDSLAHEGWLYERAYTTVPHTSKALIGIYCGTFPQFDPRAPTYNEVEYPLNCLPKLLESVGYRTAHFQTAPGSFEGRSQFLKNAGFSHAVTQEDLSSSTRTHYGYLGLDDRLLVEPMLEWMKRKKIDGHPFFASILTVLTHHPYVSPGNTEPRHNSAEAKQAYEKAVQYNDNVLRELLAGMKRNGLLDNTIVVVTGDHGEAFGEHQQLAHNGASYEEGMHVPLVVYAPQYLIGAKRIGGLRQHTDLLPSILNISGITYQGILPGKDLFTDTDGHDEIITSCLYDSYCLNHYGQDGSKFIYFYGRRPSEVYQLRKDPTERQNLAPELSPTEMKARLVRAASLKKSYAQSYPTH